MGIKRGRSRKERTKRKARKTRVRRQRRKQRGGAEEENNGPNGYDAVVVGKMPMIEGKLDDVDSVPVALNENDFENLTEEAET